MENLNWIEKTIAAKGFDTTNEVKFKLVVPPAWMSKPMIDSEDYEVCEIFFNHINTMHSFSDIKSFQFLFELPMPIHIQPDQMLALLYAVPRSALDNVDEIPLVETPLYDEVNDGVSAFLDGAKEVGLEIKLHTIAELRFSNTPVIEFILHASGSKLSGNLLGYITNMYNYYVFFGALVHENETTLGRSICQNIVQAISITS